MAALVVALTEDSQPQATTASAGGCPVSTIARQELPSVVTISVSAGPAGGTGSGEIIDEDNHILTNNHVISAAASGGSIRVTLNDGRTAEARLVGRDPRTDLAVIQVPDLSGLRPITFGSSAGVQVGQPVVALGAPLGLSSTVTAGIVSAVDRTINLPADDGQTAVLVAAIQTDAAINPGNSGGALVDCAGKLIGIPTAGATVPTENGAASGGSIGLGFAIPADFARSIADELIAHGRATHAFFGVSVASIEHGSAPALFVAAVTPNGPAQQAGLRDGDVITRVNDEPATSAEQLLQLTLTKQPGEQVAVTYERDGEQHTTTITLGSG